MKRFLTFILLLFSLAQLTYAQSFRETTLTGVVLDENNEPMPGAVVTSADGKRGEMTDVNGKFTMKLQPSDKTVIVSTLGYVAQTIDIVGKSTIKVLLVPDLTNSLNEAVVIGYDVVKKADLTGSVTNVKMADVVQSANLSVGQALQGRVAGVDVMSTSGEPGEGTSIRIRGTRSINASNEPLIVVDGVMDVVSDISLLNPDDIESISLLKDASATAIYGAQGANGVIMVTTKSGVTAKPRINFGAQFGVSQLARKLDIMNAQEFARYYNDRIYFSRGSDSGATLALDPSTYGTGTDWQDEITRIAPYQNYNISMSGKIQKLDYYASGGYTNDQGIIKGSGMERYTARLNVGYQVFNWLKIEFKGAYNFSRQNPNKANIGGTNLGNGALYLSPLIGPHDTYNPLYESGTVVDTPVSRIENITNYIDKHDNIRTLVFTIKPIKGLTFKSSNTYKTYNRHDYQYYPNTLATRYDSQGGKAYRYELDNMRLYTDNTVKYDKNLRGGHHFDVLAGYTLSYVKDNLVSVTADGIVSDELTWKNLNAIGSKENYNISSGSNKVIKESFLARANYNYNGKYYITFTGRYDGSSNFAKNNKWGFFPSVALKWNAKKERFVARSKTIDDLSFRASIGKTGNDAFSAYTSLERMGSTTSGYIFDGTQPLAFYRNRLGNPDLTWEKTTLANLAGEIAMFNNRLSVNAEVYWSRTTDLLLNVQTAHVSGYASRYQNLGKTTNRGVELTIDTKNIQRRNFGWTTTFTMSHNKQMVVDIGNEEYVSCLSSYGNNSYMMYGYKAGYPLNALWGFQYAGPWRSQDEIDRNKYTKTYASVLTQSPGIPKYVDRNGDGIISQDDLIYLGSSDPYLYGGLQNNFTWKDWKLSVYFTYSLGGKIYNYAEMFMAGGNATNQFRYMLDAWHPVRNPDSWYPRSSTDDAFVPSTLMLHDASYLRFKTLSLSRTFEFKKQRVFKNITLTLKGDNLFLWTKYNGYDPDVSTESDGSVLRRVDKGAYPKARRVIFGIQLRY